MTKRCWILVKTKSIFLYVPLSNIMEIKTDFQKTKYNHANYSLEGLTV